MDRLIEKSLFKQIGEVIGTVVIKMYAVILKKNRSVHDVINIEELVSFFLSQLNNLDVNGSGHQTFIDPPPIGKSSWGRAKDYLILARNIVFLNKALVFPEKVIGEILRIVGSQHEDKIFMITTDGFLKFQSFRILICRWAGDCRTSLAIVVHLIITPQERLQS